MLISSVIRLASLCAVVGPARAWIASSVGRLPTERLTLHIPTRFVGAMLYGGSGYERMADDSGEVDASHVEALLQQRQEFRQKKRYDDADAVREELRGMGVSVWDRDRVWSCSSSPPSRGNLRKRVRIPTCAPCPPTSLRPRRK